MGSGVWVCSMTDAGDRECTPAYPLSNVCYFKIAVRIMSFSGSAHILLIEARKPANEWKNQTKYKCEEEYIANNGINIMQITTVAMRCAIKQRCTLITAAKVRGISHRPKSAHNQQAREFVFGSLFIPLLVLLLCSVTSMYCKRVIYVLLFTWKVCCMLSYCRSKMSAERSSWLCGCCIRTETTTND